MIAIEIPVAPVAKARARSGRNGFYTPKKTVEFEAQVKHHARMCMFGQGKRRYEDMPLKVDVEFRILKPKSVSKKREYPCVKSDLDNYLKALFDALNGIVFKDDALVCEVHAKKVYCTKNPGIELIISPL